MKLLESILAGMIITAGVGLGVFVIVVVPLLIIATCPGGVWITSIMILAHYGLLIGLLLYLNDRLITR